MPLVVTKLKTSLVVGIRVPIIDCVRSSFSVLGGRENNPQMEKLGSRGQNDLAQVLTGGAGRMGSLQKVEDG
jgi:hypothetical protein